VAGTVFKTVCETSESKLRWVRFPHASAISILDFGFPILDWLSVHVTMTELEFKNRTKQIALRVIRLIETLPNKMTAQVIGKQFLRSATSVGANYRAACRGKSQADVIHK
jgi:hypothetical protein